jgi:hypothetical protein
MMELYFIKTKLMYQLISTTASSPFTMITPLPGTPDDSRQKN